MKRTRHASRRIAALVFLAAAVVPFALANPAHAAGGVEVKATINEIALENATANHPLKISPNGQTTVHIEVHNTSDDPITIRNVRVNGKVLGFEFFVFTTRVDLTVASGATGDRTFTAELTDLDGQAAGLLDGQLSIVSDTNKTLATTGFTLDARGSAVSTYTLFGVALVLLTALLAAGTIRRALNGTLPANRWSRAVRFAQPGAGLGMVLVFTLSALRIALLPAGLGFALIAIGILGGAAIGYLLPSEADDDVDAPATIDLTSAPADAMRVPELVDEP